MPGPRVHLAPWCCTPGSAVSLAQWPHTRALLSVLSPCGARARLAGTRVTRLPKEQRHQTEAGCVLRPAVSRLHPWPEGASPALGLECGGVQASGMGLSCPLRPSSAPPSSHKTGSEHCLVCACVCVCACHVILDAHPQLPAKGLPGEFTTTSSHPGWESPAPPSSADVTPPISSSFLPERDPSGTVQSISSPLRRGVWGQEPQAQ